MIVTRTRMVGSRHPQRRAPTHALVARHDVLQRNKHAVAHVQRPSHVGWWHGHGVWLTRRVRLWLEEAGALPPPAWRGMG